MFFAEVGIRRYENGGRTLGSAATSLGEGGGTMFSPCPANAFQFHRYIGTTFLWIETLITAWQNKEEIQIEGVGKICTKRCDMIHS
jgi:hypothetical protein